LNHSKILFKTWSAIVAGSLLTQDQGAAAGFTVTVKNLTNGIYFTPLLISAHDGGTHLIETDSPRSATWTAVSTDS
jgi:hypothetical protein